MNKDSDEATTRINERKALCSALHLDTLGLRTYDMVRHYFNRTKGAGSHKCPEISNQKEGNGGSFTFSFRGRLYKLSSGSLQSDRGGRTLEVEVDSVKVLALLSFTVFDESPGDDRIEIDGFIPGDWSKDFLELEPQLRTFIEKESVQDGRAATTRKLEEDKKNFGLG